MYIYKCIYDEITGIIMCAFVRLGGACCRSYRMCDPEVIIRDGKNGRDLRSGYEDKIKYRRYLK